MESVSSISFDYDISLLSESLLFLPVSGRLWIFFFSGIYVDFFMLEKVFPTISSLILYKSIILIPFGFLIGSSKLSQQPIITILLGFFRIITWKSHTKTYIKLCNIKISYQKIWTGYMYVFYFTKIKNFAFVLENG